MEVIRLFIQRYLLSISIGQNFSLGTNGAAMDKTQKGTGKQFILLTNNIFITQFASADIYSYFNQCDGYWLMAFPL